MLGLIVKPDVLRKPLFHHVINIIGLLQYMGLAQCLSDILRISEMQSIIASMIGNWRAFGNGGAAIPSCLEALRSNEPNDPVMCV
jgi:hypothetical protein